MKPRPIIYQTLTLAALLLVQTPAWACAVCYGEPGSPMTSGLNWAILVLGGFIGMVLTGVAGFFVYVRHRATAIARPTPPDSKTSI
ncbi:MAG: hypothetical protein U1F83_00910 [Verrucomicrobiota bacterium]